MAQRVNSALVLLYWQIGQRIRSDILKEKRAEYGGKIVPALSAQLSAEVCPEAKIVHALSAQLSWTHLRLVIYLDDPLEREFYAAVCRTERWNTRTLNEKIQSMLFERTALSKKPDRLMAAELKKLREEGELSPDLVFRDPYLLRGQVRRACGTDGATPKRHPSGQIPHQTAAEETPSKEAARGGATGAAAAASQANRRDRGSASIVTIHLFVRWEGEKPITVWRRKCRYRKSAAASPVPWPCDGARRSPGVRPGPDRAG